MKLEASHLEAALACGELAKPSRALRRHAGLVELERVRLARALETQRVRPWWHLDRMLAPVELHRDLQRVVEHLAREEPDTLVAMLATSRDPLALHAIVRDLQQAKFDLEPIGVLTKTRGFALESLAIEKAVGSLRARSWPGQLKTGFVLDERVRNLIEAITHPRPRAEAMRLIWELQAVTVRHVVPGHPQDPELLAIMTGAVADQLATLLEEHDEVLANGLADKLSAEHARPATAVLPYAAMRLPDSNPVRTALLAAFEREVEHHMVTNNWDGPQDIHPTEWSFTEAAAWMLCCAPDHEARVRAWLEVVDRRSHQRSRWEPPAPVAAGPWEPDAWMACVAATASRMLLDCSDPAADAIAKAVVNLVAKHLPEWYWSCNHVGRWLRVLPQVMVRLHLRAGRPDHEEAIGKLVRQVRGSEVLVPIGKILTEMNLDPAGVACVAAREAIAEWQRFETSLG